MPVVYAGVSAVPFTCAYTAAKHAVVGMMRCAAAEYTPQGLRINCINPGPTGGLPRYTLVLSHACCICHTAASHQMQPLTELDGKVTSARCPQE